MAITYEFVEEASDTVAVGLVIRQEPEPGQYDPNDDIHIIVYVSTGPADPDPEPEPEPEPTPVVVNLAVYLGGRSPMRNRRRYG